MMLIYGQSVIQLCYAFRIKTKIEIREGDRTIEYKIIY